MFVYLCDFAGSDSVGGGDFVHSERSKKERLRRLSVVDTTSSSYDYDHQHYQMGCDNMSDTEDELRLQESSLSCIGSSKRFKIPKKVQYFYDAVCLVLDCCSHFLTYNEFLVQFFDDCNGVDHASVPRKLRSGVWFMNQEMDDLGFFFFLGQLGSLQFYFCSGFLFILVNFLEALKFEFVFGGCCGKFLVLFWYVN
jgi:hypothetical protein